MIYFFKSGFIRYYDERRLLLQYRNMGQIYVFSVVKINTVSAVQHSGQANGVNIRPVQSFADDF